MFEDRKDAGRNLALRLESYRGKGALVLAIPRGGVEIGIEVALHLDAGLSLLVARKLPYPGEPETGFGAIAEDGSTYLIPEMARLLTPHTIDEIIARQKQEILRRVRVLRGGRPPAEMAGRTVILVDDGLAMGSTMQAALRMCRNKQAGRIVLAVPVADRATAERIATAADEAVVLETPRWFRAVAQVYRHWHDVPDSEVLGLLEELERSRNQVGGAPTSRRS
jgi:putative phosphoribosyl transferase